MVDTRIQYFQFITYDIISCYDYPKTIGFTPDGQLQGEYLYKDWILCMKDY